MTNPNFTASISTNELYRDLDTTVCLTDLLDEYDADILALESAVNGLGNTYAPANHEHDDYATDDDITALQNAIASKADSTHTHSEYALSGHSHSGYVSTSAFDALEAEVDGKASASHTHSDYAVVSHVHDGYAVVGHDHDDDYAPISHTHSDYATVTELNEVEAAVSGKANASHTHDDRYYTESEIDTKLSANLASANAYTDAEIANLLDNSTAAIDSIMELVEVMEDNADAIETLESIAASKADASHVHAISEVTNLQSELDSLESAINGKAASNHTHAAATQSAAGFMSASDKAKLDGIAANANNYTYTLPSAGTALGGVKSGGDVTISGGLITVNDDSHNHVIGNVDGLQEALDGKAASSHTHNDVYYTESEIDGIVSGLNTSIAGKAASSHTHTISNVTNLQSTLDAKVPTSRTVNGKALTANIILSASDVGADASGTAATQAAAALQSAKDYADDIKDDLLNGAGTAYDTLKELGDLIDTNADAIDALETVAAGKASTSALNAHTGNTSNPHNVTLAQLGITATAAELNKMDGVTATTAELNYVDGVTSNIQTQLNAKASSSHTHSAATTSAAGLMSAADKTKLDGIATGATKITVDSALSSTSTNPVQNKVINSALAGKAASSHTHNYAGSSSAGGAATSANKLATARTISLTGDVTGSTSFDGSGNVSITATVADDSHNHTIANVDGLQSALNAKSASNHKHYAQEVTTTGTNLNDYTDAGIYVFAQAYAPVNVPAGTNGWLVVMPWGEGGGTIKQLWFRHGTSGTNDHETYVRTKISNVSTWSPWSKYYTTSNPPTAAEVGATPAFTNSIGGVEYSFNTSDGKNVLDEIASMPQGLHTIYSQGGVSGNPKTTESWRLLVHKTSATIGWVVAFGSSGSVYANYQNEADHFQGWKCVYEATNKMILWNGASYLTSTNGTPQVVTPSKKLSECRTGWLLLWSDYDASTSTANDTDFCTTYIPKYTPTGGTWGGKAFYCSVPTYVGGDASDVSTEIRVIKPVYVHDDKLVGSYQNTTGGRNDVVLRAVYEV